MSGLQPPAATITLPAHPHTLQLVPNLSDGGGSTYRCEPCNYSLYMASTPIPNPQHGAPSVAARGNRTAKSAKRDPSSVAAMKDPYEVLGVSRSATDQEIKSAYRRMALKYHPDKNADDPVASAKFQEATFSNNILSDPDKRKQYDKSGFEGIESDSHESELDLSSLGTVNTMFAALFSKLGVPIKTTVSTTVLVEASNRLVGTKVEKLELGDCVKRKVEKQSANFYSVAITEEQAMMGLVCRVKSTHGSKFKLLYFNELEENRGLGLALQEDSVKTGKDTSAGMYFLGFPVYRFELNYLAAATKDSRSALIKMMDSFQPCDINELKSGTHYFAVYGDNFFKTASYTIEIVCGQKFSDQTNKLKDVEKNILTKRAELSKLETERREDLAKSTEMKRRYKKEKEAIGKLLEERNAIHASYTKGKKAKSSSPGSTERSRKKLEKGTDREVPSNGGEHDDSTEKKTSSKKKWMVKKIRN
ncbi:unnamed protein product [Alopecurus aequalis]